MVGGLRSGGVDRLKRIRQAEGKNDGTKHWIDGSSLDTPGIANLPRCSQVNYSLGDTQLLSFGKNPARLIRSSAEQVRVFPVERFATRISPVAESTSNW